MQKESFFFKNKSRYTCTVTENKQNKKAWYTLLKHYLFKPTFQVQQSSHISAFFFFNSEWKQSNFKLSLSKFQYIQGYKLSADCTFSKTDSNDRIRSSTTNVLMVIHSCYPLIYCNLTWGLLSFKHFYINCLSCVPCLVCIWYKFFDDLK